MTLKTRLGNLGNISTRTRADARVLQLDSPVLSNAEFEAMRVPRRVMAIVDRLHLRRIPPAGDNASSTRSSGSSGRPRIAVRGGCEHLILTDKHVSEERAPIPMILATGGVHSHLVRQKLRTFTSLNVRSGRVPGRALLRRPDRRRRDHDQRLPGAGVDRRPPPSAACSANLSLEECVRALPTAVDATAAQGHVEDGHLGAELLPGGYNFEAVGLSRTLVD